MRKCRYFNKGHCKYRERCKFNHPKDICKTYLDCGKCVIENCRDRHPQLCKYWSKSKSGCKRNSSCDFLHVTLVQGDVNVKDVEENTYKCAGCENAWTKRNCVVEHIISNHKKKSKLKKMVVTATSMHFP